MLYGNATGEASTLLDVIEDGSKFLETEVVKSRHEPHTLHVTVPFFCRGWSIYGKDVNREFSEYIYDHGARAENPPREGVRR